MSDKYSMTVKIFDSESDARAFCDEVNAAGDNDKRAVCKPWESPDGDDDRFAVWYWHEIEGGLQ